MEQSSSSEALSESDQFERLHKRIVTLEKDKMRLWKEQNVQRKELSQLHDKWQTLRSSEEQLTPAEEDLAPIAEEIAPPQPQIVVAPNSSETEQALEQMSHELTHVRRQLSITTWLVLFLVIALIDWPMLWSSVQYWFYQLSQLWQ